MRKAGSACSKDFAHGRARQAYRRSGEGQRHWYFADDIIVDGMLYARCVYSRYPRAHIDRIDVTRAAAHPDCVKVLTKADVPCNKIGHIKQDWDVMMGEGDITRYVGNVLAVIATDKRKS